MARSRPTSKDLQDFILLFASRYYGPAAAEQVNESLQVRTERGTRPVGHAGLKMAVNDCLDVVRYFSPSEFAELDDELQKKGLVSLTELRYHLSNDYRRIMNRNKIRDDIEYYLVKNIISDVELGSDEERDRIIELMTKYENR